VGVGGAGQHADIGASAEYPVLAGAQHHHLHLGVLEAQPLRRVGQLDVDAQVVGVELELVARKQRRRLIDIHDELGHLTVDFQLPVAIARRIGLKIDVL